MKKDKPSLKLRLINKLIKRYGYKSYLEVGCRKRKTLKGVRAKVKVGVDIVWPCEYKMSSDEFFACNTKKYDIVLVEANRQGNHPYNDVVNALAILNENGTVVVRGANQPKKWFYDKTLKIPRYKETVWLAVSRLRCERKDLEIRTIKDENGLTIIRYGQQEPYDLPGQMLTKEYFLKHRRKLLNLIEWKDV